MTNSPAPATTPLPNVPLDLTQNTSQAAGAALEKIAYTGELAVGTRVFTLVSKLSALDMVILQEAQESGQFRQIIEAVPRLVQKAQQDDLKSYLLSDPDDEDDRVTLDDVLTAMTNGLEQLASRPTDR
jgi:2-oxo-4-hydroxy-4-carboxy--5-ureidoimidazoline (OHCU) decarboxylase